jgi:hypothetical protein
MPAKKMPKMYKGKSTAPGGGGHFAMVVDALKKSGKSVATAKAIAAAAGRKKYGAKKFAKMAVAGRKRAAKKRAKK